MCSGKERFFADLLATHVRRIKSEITQHPFLSVDRLLEKAQGPNPGLFRFLGLVLCPSASRSDAMRRCYHCQAPIPSKHSFRSVRFLKPRRKKFINLTFQNRLGRLSLARAYPVCFEVGVVKCHNGTNKESDHRQTRSAPSSSRRPTLVV